ncbi:MAG: hypothetical protein EPN53_01605 [Acidobacteria bacterium]|nr:MAG: hypothetical protein EPN53_01605 [Acidobacteriota bacterium]
MPGILGPGNKRLLPSKGLRPEGLFDGADPIPADMKARDLAAWLVENSVPWIECWRKCLAACICPFAEPRFLGGGAPERRCGVQANAIHNLFATAGRELDLSRRDQLEQFLSGAISYAGLAQLSLILAVTATCPGAAGAWGKGVSRVRLFEAFGLADQVQQFLGRLRPAIRETAKPVRWFVEGESERVFFLALLKHEHGDKFLPSRLQSIRGSGNVKNLRMVLEQAKADGVQGIVIVDRLTTSLVNEAQKLISEGLLDRQALIVFNRDFESSFPPEFLTRAFWRVAGAEHKETIREAARRSDGAGSPGFVTELQRLLRSQGWPAQAAKELVEGWKVPAARILARIAVRTLDVWISGRQVDTVEIAGVVRDVVWSTLWFGSRPSSSLAGASG